MEKVRNTAMEHLRKHGIKPSLQRIAIMEYLMQHTTHPTADMIFTDLYPSIPTLSKATVYNTLNLLVERGAVRMITIDEKNARFDACMHPHIHFRCRQCGVIMDIAVEREWVPVLPDGLKVDSCQTYCIGLCPDCMKESVTLH